jgi:phenylalanyl-tRNA synthetase beta chain
MGGATTELSSNTRNVVIEAATSCDDVLASRRHKLSSEASRRFEETIPRPAMPQPSGR